MYSATLGIKESEVDGVVCWALNQLIRYQLQALERLASDSIGRPTLYRVECDISHVIKMKWENICPAGRKNIICLHFNVTPFLSSLYGKVG